RFIDRFRSTATKARQVQSRIKALDKIERVDAPGAERAVHFRIQPAGRPERAVVTVQDLSHAYDDHIVLVGANLEIERGEKVALVGPNGGGKSTLLRAMAGHIAPTEGRIAWAERAEFGYYDQHQDEALDPGRTVLEEVASIAGDHTDGDLRSVLGRFLFRGDDVYKRIAVLSGGERSRVALAKFLIRPSNVLLLDEPTNHLDGATRARLVKALADYDGTIICASHDREILRRVATRAVQVEEGECRPLRDWRAGAAARS
ncbi:MAG: ATP-binding cassette domain-containing protein, partial [Chloroflexi bacterium]|nr:ATP-binding cassette domain-containing protein [Chloroflexota bacterium]